MSNTNERGDEIAAMTPQERDEHARRLAERIDELGPRQQQIVLDLIEELASES